MKINVRYGVYVVGFVEGRKCSFSYLKNGRVCTYEGVTLKENNEDCVALQDILDTFDEEAEVFAGPEEFARDRISKLQRIVEEHNKGIRNA